MTNNDNKNVEFETVPEVTENPVTGRAVPVEQKVINPPSGIAALIILIFLCLHQRSDGVERRRNTNTPRPASLHSASIPIRRTSQRKT